MRRKPTRKEKMLQKKLETQERLSSTLLSRISDLEAAQEDQADLEEQETRGELMAQETEKAITEMLRVVRRKYSNSRRKIQDIASVLRRYPHNRFTLLFTLFSTWFSNHDPELRENTEISGDLIGLGRLDPFLALGATSTCGSNNAFESLRDFVIALEKDIAFCQQRCSDNDLIIVLLENALRRKDLLHLISRPAPVGTTPTKERLTSLISKDPDLQARINITITVCDKDEAWKAASLLGILQDLGSVEKNPEKMLTAMLYMLEKASAGCSNTCSWPGADSLFSRLPTRSIHNYLDDFHLERFEPGLFRH